ncbi:MAG: hypothetical protein CMH57_13025 [Myxococcales bacterium]|nr:hypothetical protein [Myxococcales bacterium]
MSTTRSQGENELQRIIQEMEVHISDIRVQLAAAVKDTERIQKALEYQRHMVSVWDKKTDMAREAKREDLVQEAQEHTRRHAGYAREIEEELQQIQGTAARYRDQMNAFELKIEAAKVRIEVLWARRKRQQMQQSVEAPANRLAHSIDRFDQLMQRMEAEMEIDQELREPRRPEPAPEPDQAASRRLEALKTLKPLHPNNNTPEP